MQKGHKFQYQLILAALPRDEKHAVTVVELFGRLDRRRFINPGNVARSLGAAIQAGYSIKEGEPRLIQGEVKKTYYLVA